MKKRTPVTILAAAVLVSCGRSGTAARPSPTPHQTAATATFQDADLSLGSDYGGPYQNSVNGIICVIQSGGNFGVDTRASTRTIRLDFSASAGGTLPLAWTNPTRFVPLRMVTQVVNPGTMALVETGLLGIPEGSTWLTELYCSFTDPATPNWDYALNFFPLRRPETSFLSVTRLDANTWRIWFASGSDIGRLVGTPNSNGKPAPTTEFGLFHVPCDFTVVAQP
jgi:hypothetical protein